VISPRRIDRVKRSAFSTHAGVSPRGVDLLHQALLAVGANARRRFYETTAMEKISFSGFAYFAKCDTHLYK
jgi:hypothetical protein